MKRFILLVLITVLCSAAICAQATKSTPQLTIKTFYSWYLQELLKNRFPLAEQPAKMKKFITRRCYNENKKAYDNNEFDADYFISAQDFHENWAKNIRISNVRINGSRATARVLLGTSGKFNSKLKLKLVKEENVWKIDVIDPVLN